MSKPVMVPPWRVLVTLAAIVLGLLLLSQSMLVQAEPQPGRVAGITVTPTAVTPVTPTLTPPPRREIADPVIFKSAEPTEAKPGGEVAFTLYVINNGNVGAVGVVVTDDVPAYLEIVGVTTTQGEITIDGQRVTVQVGTIGPAYEVTIVIRTRVRPETPAPLTVENVAILSCPNCHDRWARTLVDITGPDLPVTGGLGTWWMVAACLGTGLVGLSLALSKRGMR